MFKIIVFTHGPLAAALKEAASMLVGSLDQMGCFSVMPGCDLSALSESVKDSITRSNAAGQGVLVFSDLFFGTPFNILVDLSQKVEFYHITGVNLPLLIEAANYSRQENAKIGEVVKDLMEFSKDTVKDANQFLASL